MALPRQASLDLLAEPMYRIGDLARFLHLSPSRVRNWLLGYLQAAPQGGPGARVRPVIKDREPGMGQNACFLDLIELRLIHDLLERDWTIQRIRKAHADLAERLGSRYPFAQEQFYLLGTKLFVAFEDHGKRHLIEALSGGQYAIEPIIRHVSEELRFDPDSGRACQWWPLPDTQVVLDPSNAFGAPTVAGRNVKTANVFAMYEAEGGRAEPVARWFGITLDEVRDAVRFEEHLRAA